MTFCIQTVNAATNTINSNNEYALNSEYLYKGSSVEIDAGSLNMVEIDTNIFNTITSVEETKNG